MISTVIFCIYDDIQNPVQVSFHLFWFHNVKAFKVALLLKKYAQHTECIPITGRDNSAISRWRYHTCRLRQMKQLVKFRLAIIQIKFAHFVRHDALTIVFVVAESDALVIFETGILAGSERLFDVHLLSTSYRWKRAVYLELHPIVN